MQVAAVHCTGPAAAAAAAGRARRTCPQGSAPWSRRPALRGTQAGLGARAQGAGSRCVAELLLLAQQSKAACG